MSIIRKKIVSWFEHRSLIGSDTVILAASAIHLYEALIFLFVTPTDGWGIGMTALLMLCQTPRIAAVVLFAVSTLSLYAQLVFDLHLKLRWILLLPQLTLAILTSAAAVYASAVQEYANGVHESWAFISTDQPHRILWPIVYAAAIWARIRYRS